MLVLGLLFAPVILEPSGPARLMAEEATGAVTGRIPAWPQPWSLWSQHPSLEPVRGALQAAYLPFLGLVTLTAWTFRGGSLRGHPWPLALLGGAAVAFSQLFSPGAPGRPILWVLPFILVLWLGPGRSERSEAGPLL